MSGIYIPGMVMPTAGTYLCELGVLDENTAVLTVYTPIDKPQVSYKLVPVPPHGRLIDADALMKKGMPLSFSVQKWVQEVDIACAPTVIPASEEDQQNALLAAVQARIKEVQK